MTVIQGWTQHVILRTLCRDTKLSQHLMGYIKENHFTSESYKLAFKRLKIFYDKRGRTPSWSELTHDTSLSDKITKKLRVTEIRRKTLKKKDESLLLPKNFDEASTIFRKLVIDSKHRAIVEYQNKLTDKVQIKKKSPSEEDIKELLSFCKKELDGIESLEARENGIISLFDRDSGEIYSSIKNRAKRGFIPTGFREFDSINIGIPTDSLLLIAASTGAGKSTLARQLGMNVCKQGGRACIASLEMSVDENSDRMVSALTGVKSLDLIRNPKKYKKKIIRAWDSFFTKKKGDIRTLDYYIPRSEETMIDILNSLKAYKYDIILIDYLTLTAQLDKDQWRSLDMVCRYGKIFATQNNTIVGVLAQWDSKEEQIRYSRAIQEHASNGFQWIATEENKELGFITVHQPKARNQKQFSFKLKVNWDTSLISDYTEIDNDEDSNDKKKKKGSKNKHKRRMPKEFDEVPDDDDI